jgi:AcrR family transcriptional regulator
MKKETVNKKKILECSIKLFARKGFSGTSIREITKEVGTTVPNIYYYFGSKEGLYNYILESTTEHFSKTIKNAVSAKTGLRDQLIAMTKAKYEFMEEYPELMRIFFREWFASESEAEVAKETQPVVLKALATMAYMVRERIALGELRKINPEYAAWFLIGVFNAFDLGFINLGLTPSNEEIEAVVDLALEGLAKNPAD